MQFDDAAARDLHAATLALQKSRNFSNRGLPFESRMVRCWPAFHYVGGTNFTLAMYLHIKIRGCFHCRISSSRSEGSSGTYHLWREANIQTNKPENQVGCNTQDSVFFCFLLGLNCQLTCFPASVQFLLISISTIFHVSARMDMTFQPGLEPPIHNYGSVDGASTQAAQLRI